MKIIFCLEDLRSVYNVGSIFRSAEGFGFNNFALIGITPTPFDKNGNKRKDFIKTALGAEDRILWEYFETPQKLITKYNNAKIISLEINNNSENIKNIFNNYSARFTSFLNNDKNSNEKTFLIFIGSEVSGISKEILNISDEIYHIPMYGEKESFNVSVATGIMMYVIKEKLTK